MSRAIGIDLRDQHVTVALLRVAYKKLTIEQLHEEPIAPHGDAVAALRVITERMGGFAGHGIDAVGASLEGGRTMVQQVKLPASAERKLVELLPFELEANLPMEIDEVVYAYQTMPRKRGSGDAIELLTVSARKELMRGELDRYEGVLGREPDYVSSGGLVLGQLGVLNDEVKAATYALVLDIGFERSDACFLENGLIRGARTLSSGVSSFPEKAESFVAQLRQTTAFFGAHEGLRIFIVGDGAGVAGLPTYLSERLNVGVEVLTIAHLEGVQEERRGELPLYARALANAIGAGLGRGMNLRQGEFAFQRGYGFLKEKAPLLGGLGVAILLSFLFSTWAESRALESETVMLEASLGDLTKKSFDEEITEPAEAIAALDVARQGKPEDPMPYLDGFGAAVVLAETMPDGIKHDVEQLEFSKGKLKIRGVVDTTEEAQQVQKALDDHRCLENVNIAKMTQVVGSQRTRYQLEADVRCPEEPQPAKKKTAAAATADDGAGL